MTSKTSWEKTYESYTFPHDLSRIFGKSSEEMCNVRKFFPTSKKKSQVKRVNEEVQTLNEWQSILNQRASRMETSDHIGNVSLQIDIQRRDSLTEVSRLLNKHIDAERDKLGSERFRFNKKAQRTGAELGAQRKKLKNDQLEFAKKIRFESQILRNEKKQIQGQREELKAESKKLEGDRIEFERQRHEMVRNQSGWYRLKKRAQKLNLKQRDLRLREMSSDNSEAHHDHKRKLEHQRLAFWANALQKEGTSPNEVNAQRVLEAAQRLEQLQQDLRQDAEDAMRVHSLSNINDGARINFHIQKVLNFSKRS